MLWVASGQGVLRADAEARTPVAVRAALPPAVTVELP
jgi:hypothetical protein